MALRSCAPRLASMSQPLVMQLIVDRRLIVDQGWPVGPMMAQGAHATAAVLAQTAAAPDTAEYLAPENLQSMRKVVLQAPDGTGLRDVAAQLDAARAESAEVPPHYLWVEQPEDVPTCLAVAPNRKPKVSSMLTVQALTKVLRKCALLRV